MKIIKDCLTGIDGQTFDAARVYLAAGVIMFLLLAGYAVYKGQPWTPVEFGTGFGTLLAGAGAAIKLKEKTEPTAGGAS
ncbi:amino acid ABC transporter substrate-binding protein [Geobacter sp. FeAm09]|uniref:amino acid ABC transporter substrate-binding protein n=1 Tax=Geobacter sp. FeAm09 TaxID=2597769 RepID=UPI0011EEB6BB|nr:amino acid ABC transporter substrate-binding protein [Geobacter sp. FeAm09]QEM67588.1 amino acid ABC transporter substrate-binding protein [Geobacter sp. FeAm09]